MFYARIHAAANLVTGEVLTTNHSSYLKHRVAEIEHRNIRLGFGSGRWVFAHGSDWREKLGVKIEKLVH